jgi:hypothetical protein
MPVSVTMPTIMPAAAQATDTMMAFLAPFSRAVDNAFNFIEAEGQGGGPCCSRLRLAALPPSESYWRPDWPPMC